MCHESHTTSNELFLPWKLWASDNLLGHVQTVICELLCSTGSITVRGMFQSQKRSTVLAKVDSLLPVYTVLFCINSMELFVPISLCMTCLPCQD